VIEMRARYEAGETVTELARVFGVSRGPMRKILNYETYKEVA
jgi:DNA-binding GntR family transcriptional regulator